jgi:hypothetical protein
MKNKLLLSSFVLLAAYYTANAQYNAYQYQNEIYKQQQNSYKPAGYGYYSTPNSSGSYGSYNYNSYTPSYNYNSYNSYTPSYNSYYDSYSPSYNSNSSYNSENAVTTTHYANSKVVFCENVDANWNPVGIYSIFTITPGNGFIKMFVENAATLKTTAITAKIHLEKSGVYSFIDEQTYTFNADAVNSAKAAMNYDFSKNGAGSYRVDFYSKENVFINSGYVTIQSNYAENTSKKTEEVKSSVTSAPTNSSVTNSDYYKNSKIYFFENGEEYDLAGEGRNSLYLNLGNNSAYIEVANDKALNTTKLLVSIEKKDSKGTYQPYEKKEFSYGDLNSTSVYFTYNFKEAGDYRFDVKSKEGFWVNADYVSVYRK